LRLLKAIDRVIHLFETAFLALGLLAMAGALFAQAVLGYFGVSVSWAGELATYLMVWVTCVGASAATRAGRHIAIEVISARLGGAARRALELAVGAVCLGVCAAAVVAGVNYAAGAAETGQVTVSLKIPLWIIYAALPVAAGLMAVRIALLLALPRTGGEPGEGGGG